MPGKKLENPHAEITALTAKPPRGVLALTLCTGCSLGQAQSDWKFEDITASLDVDWRFVLSSDHLDGRDMMTGGLAAADIDGDGWVDLYIPRGDRLPGLLLKNMGDGTFRDAAAKWNLLVSGDNPMSYATGAAFADIDGNGFPDLILGGIRQFGLRLFLNDGREFRRAEADWGLDADLQDQFSIAFADVDGDFRLDLAVGHWNMHHPQGSRGGHLWLQTDSGFVDASDAWGIAETFLSEDFSFTPNFVDLTGNGWPDLLIAADFGTSKVFHNIDGTRFKNVTSAVISDQNGMGAAIGDFDGDGRPDWFVTSIWSELYTVEPEAGFSGNRLYRNSGAGVFEDVTDPAGVRKGYWGWGACAADFDNSGKLDLFHVNGFMPEDRQASRLFINAGNARFVEQSEARGIADYGQGRGIVCFDYDRDGDIDVFIQNNGEAGRVYRNTASENGNHWLAIRLRADAPNTQGIGARIELTAGKRTQLREMTIPNHYLSTGPAELHFGLGQTARAERLQITWPNGQLETYRDLPADRWLTIHQACGTVDPSHPHGRRQAMALRHCLRDREGRQEMRRILQKAGRNSVQESAGKPVVRTRQESSR